MAIPGALWIFLPYLLTLIAAAPGDGDIECPVPSYSNGIIVLMDSWRYQTLLSPLPPSPVDPSAVWVSPRERMDSAQWYGTGGTCRQGGIEVCITTDMRQPGLVYTQYIRKPSSATYLIPVYVETHYTLSQCRGTGCDDFELLAYITNTPDDEERVDEGNYNSGLIAPDSEIPGTSILSTNNKTVQYFQLFGAQNGFYLSFESTERMCVTIMRVLAYVKACLSTENGLVRYSATPSPFVGSVSSVGRCAENAHHTEDSRPDTLRCNILGQWINDETRCECNPGFYQDDTVCRAYLTPVENSYTVREEQTVVQVCLQMAAGLPLSLPLTVSTVDITAIGGFDYVPVNRNITKLQFTMSSGTIVGCIDVQLVNDNLKEKEESFAVEVKNGSSVFARVQVNISSNDDENVCTEGSLTVTSGHDNSSLQLVEMCDSNEGVWSPLCDNEWTLQDATVVCRETTGGLDIERYNIRSSVQQTSWTYECVGNEMMFSQCSALSTMSSLCNHLLVQCESPSPSSSAPTETVQDASSLEMGLEASTSSAVTLPASPSLGANRPGVSSSESTNTRRNRIVAGIAVSLIIVILLVVVGGVLAMFVHKKWRDRTKYNIANAGGNGSPSSRKRELKNPIYEGVGPATSSTQPPSETRSAPRDHVYETTSLKSKTASVKEHTYEKTDAIQSSQNEKHGSENAKTPVYENTGGSPLATPPSSDLFDDPVYAGGTRPSIPGGKKNVSFSIVHDNNAATDIQDDSSHQSGSDLEQQQEEGDYTVPVEDEATPEIKDKRQYENVESNFSSDTSL